ncbi:MAG: hypothetical protein EXQ95_14395 [Alphaproteobacteria bacterium]|nr:hypothetical protein [Alphaproteobacteria bacterium]
MKHLLAGLFLVLAIEAHADTRDDLLVAVATIEASVDHGVSAARFAEQALRLDIAHRVQVAKKASRGAADKAARELVAASNAVARVWALLRERLCTYGASEGKVSFSSTGWCRGQFAPVYAMLGVELPLSVIREEYPVASEVIGPLLTRLSLLSKAAMDALAAE